MAVPVPMSARRRFLCEEEEAEGSQDVVSHGFYRPIVHDQAIKFEPIKPLRQPHFMQKLQEQDPNKAG